MSFIQEAERIRRTTRRSRRDELNMTWLPHFRLASIRSSFNLPLTYAEDYTHHMMQSVAILQSSCVANNLSKDSVTHVSAVNGGIATTLLKGYPGVSCRDWVQVVLSISQAFFDLEWKLSDMVVIQQMILPLIGLLSFSNDLPLKLKIWVLFNLIPLGPVCDRRHDNIRTLHEYCSRVGLIERRQVYNLLRSFHGNNSMPQVFWATLWLELQQRFSIIEGEFSHNRRCLSTESNRWRSLESLSARL